MLHLSTHTLRLLLVCFWSACFLVVPGNSRGEIALSFMPIEEAKFLIKGEGWESTASIDLTIDYDTTYLSVPQMTIMGGELGDGARLDAIPGRLQLRILNKECSPNFEACIFFRKQGEYPAVINFVTAQVTGLAGAQKPVPVMMMANPNAPQPKQAVSTDEAATEQKLQTTLHGKGEQ